MAKRRKEVHSGRHSEKAYCKLMQKKLNMLHYSFCKRFSTRNFTQVLKDRLYIGINCNDKNIDAIGYVIFSLFGIS